MSKRSRIEWLIVIILILIFAYTGWHKPLIVQLQKAMIYTGLLSPDTTNPPVVSNHGIYQLQFIDEEGNVHQLQEFEGQVIFINFWATWCPPCRAEMPGIDNLFKEMQNPELKYLIITMEQDFEKARNFKAKEGFQFPIFQLVGRLPNIYAHSSSIPRSYVINKNGEMIMRHVGLADYDSKKFKSFLEDALAE